MNKITKDEKELLILKRIELVDIDKDYAKKLFKTYYKDDVKDNLKAWKDADDKTKRKVIKQIIVWENKSALKQGSIIHRTNLKGIMEFVKEFKHKQLQEFNIRKKDE